MPSKETIAIVKSMINIIDAINAVHAEVIASRSRVMTPEQIDKSLDEANEKISIMIDTFKNNLDVILDDANG